MNDQPKPTTEPTRLGQAVERFKNSGGFWGSDPTDDVIEDLMTLAGAYVESQSNLERERDEWKQRHLDILDRLEKEGWKPE